LSTDYSYTVYKDEHTTLKLNLLGIDKGISSPNKLGLSVFAFESKTGKALFNETLNYGQTVELYNYLNQVSIIKDSGIKSTGKFVESSDGMSELIEKIKAVDGDALNAILDTLNSEQKVTDLLKNLSEAELKSISAASKYVQYKKARNHLQELIQLDMAGTLVAVVKKRADLSDYAASQAEKIFQNWILANLWVFGIQYSKKHDVRQIAMTSEADILMESLDGFLDLIELKRPIEGEILKYDASHKSYYAAPSLSKAIGQSLYYLEKLDDYKLVVEKEYKVKIIRPRIKIIIGRSDSFTQKKFNALRMLNANLNHIEIYTYDYLLSCADKMLSMFNDDSEVEPVFTVIEQ